MQNLILGFDTSASHCAVALLQGNVVLEADAQHMPKGQAELLLPMIEGMLARCGQQWQALTHIGVGIGPGNFTGVRIAVATARGLSMALEVPASGVSTFDALWFGQDNLPAVVGAPGDQVYLCYPGGDPQRVPANVAHGLQARFASDVEPAELATRICRCAQAPSAVTPPAPLYLRPANARTLDMAIPQTLD